MSGTLHTFTGNYLYSSKLTGKVDRRFAQQFFGYEIKTIFISVSISQLIAVIY